MAVELATTAAELIAIERSYLGVTESPPFSNNTPFSRWYGVIGPWCDMDQCFCVAQALDWKLPDWPTPPATSTSKGFSWTVAHATYYQEAGAFQGRGFTPYPGCHVFFAWDGSQEISHIDHIGLVIDVLPDGRIHTIEGNTSGGGPDEGGRVVEHYRARSSIVGYGTPTFTGGQPAPAPAPAQPKPLPPMRDPLKPGMVGADVQLMAFFLFEAGYCRWLVGQTPAEQQQFGPGKADEVVHMKRDYNALLDLAKSHSPRLPLNAGVGTQTKLALADTVKVHQAKH